MKLNQKRIAEIMGEQGLSQSDVSKRLGHSRQNFSLIFNRGTCTLKTLVAISRALNVPVSEIAVDTVGCSDLICPITKRLCPGQGCAWWVMPEDRSEGKCAIACIACNSAFASNDIENIASRIG